jgi:hypothetical protein
VPRFTVDAPFITCMPHALTSAPLHCLVAPPRLQCRGPADPELLQTRSFASLFPARRRRWRWRWRRATGDLCLNARQPTVWYGKAREGGRAHQRVRDGQERRKVEAGQRYCRRHRRFCTAAHPPAKQRCVWFPRRVGRAKPVGRALLRDPQSVRFGRSPQCAPETMCGVMTRRQPKTMFELTITRLAPTCDQSSSRPNTGHSHECSHG